ncbi:hypothetical protein JYU34_013187 [Plutella xylostella]|uniref:Uncharacterized protein n=1 Tax=Plutella xylostella TaxID=51655 RepID=A0ABQ7QE25_PLUXY|nr:hypothetical protein JYU34_013187 [Plutella xylostella]
MQRTEAKTVFIRAFVSSRIVAERVDTVRTQAGAVVSATRVINQFYYLWKLFFSFSDDLPVEAGVCGGGGGGSAAL